MIEIPTIRRVGEIEKTDAEIEAEEAAVFEKEIDRWLYDTESYVGAAIVRRLREERDSLRASLSGELIEPLRAARQAAVCVGTYETVLRDYGFWWVEFGTLFKALPEIDKALEVLSASLSASAKSKEAAE